MLAKCVSIAPPCGKFWFILFMSSVKQLKAMASAGRKQREEAGVWKWVGKLFSVVPSIAVNTHQMSDKREHTRWFRVLTHHHPEWLEEERADHTCPARTRCQGASRYNWKNTTKSRTLFICAESKAASTFRGISTFFHHWKYIFQNNIQNLLRQLLFERRNLSQWPMITYLSFFKV